MEILNLFTGEGVSAERYLISDDFYFVKDKAFKIFDIKSYIKDLKNK